MSLRKRLLPYKIAVLGAICALLVGTPLLAQQTPLCAPYSQIVEVTENYGEKLVWQGLATDTVLGQLFVSTKDNLTWTFVLYNSNGVGCVVNSGVSSDFIMENLIEGEEM